MKKRLLFILVFAILLTAVPLAGFRASAVAGEAWDGSVGTSFDGGTGTQADPYLIGSGKTLAYLAKQVNEKKQRYNANTYFRMTDDINLGNLPWTAIGKYEDGTNANRLCFNGNFDGNGHCITGLNAVAPDSTANRVGMFGEMLTGSVRNLGIESGTVNVTTQVGGAIVAEVTYSGIVIQNCYNNATVRRISDGSNGGMMRIGGIVGVMNNANAVIADCVNYGKIDASVSGTNNNNGFGGICGLAQAGTLRNCYNLGQVNGGFCWAGGLIGFVTSANAKLENCGSSGLVYTRFSANGTTNIHCAGGYLVGRAMAAPVMTGCVAYTVDYAAVGASFVEDGKNYYPAEKLLANGDAALVSGTVNTTDHLNPTPYENAPVMLYGAGVRLVKDSSGLRFLASVSKAALDAAEADKDEGTAVTVGTLVCPVDLVEECSTFTHRALDLTGTAYQDVTATNGLSYDADGNATVRVALVGIDESNYTRAFAARTYIRYIKNGETVYLYADYVAADHARSIAEVAKAALADIRTERDKEYAFAVDGGYSPYNSAERAVLSGYLNAAN